MKHGMAGPLARLEPVDGQSLENSTVPDEILMQSGNQQALSEPARPTQKIVFARIDKLMHKGRLVDIDAAERTNLYKALNSDGIYDICHNQKDTIAKL